MVASVQCEGKLLSCAMTFASLLVCPAGAFPSRSTRCSTTMVFSITWAARNRSTTALDSNRNLLAFLTVWLLSSMRVEMASNVSSNAPSSP